MVILREDGIPVDGGFLYTQQSRMKSSGPPCGSKSQWMILANGIGRKEVGQQDRLRNPCGQMHSD